MASRSVIVSGGVSCSVMPFTARSRSTAIRAGSLLSLRRGAISGNRGPRKVSDWLPRIDEPAIDLRTGRLTVRWYNYLRELGVRLGGINGDSIEGLLAKLSASDAEQAAAILFLTQLASFAQSVQQQTQALTGAVQESGGDVSSVPPPAEPPTYRPGVKYPTEIEP